MLSRRLYCRYSYFYFLFSSFNLTSKSLQADFHDKYVNTSYNSVDKVLSTGLKLFFVKIPEDATS